MENPAENISQDTLFRRAAKDLGFLAVGIGVGTAAIEVIGEVWDIPIPIEQSLLLSAGLTGATYVANKLSKLTSGRQ